MSTYSPIPVPSAGRGRGVAPRRRTGRRGPRPIEDIGEPDFTYPDPPGMWREIPLTDSPDPARARWVELLLRDPQAARRELLEGGLNYWRARLRVLEARLAAAEQDLAAALSPAPDEDGSPPPPMPPAALFRLRAERAVAWADCQHALAQVAALERALADA